MCIRDSSSQNPLQELFQAKAELEKSQTSAPTSTPSPSPKKDSTPNSTSTQPQVSAQEDKRQTYGLLVLELMSEPEYQAFQRATAGMSEGEKIIAAQSLYSLTSFYSGKIADKNQNYQNAMGVNDMDFIARYKNAFSAQARIDLNT